MFISSECYFFQGDFANALKRLYRTLDWQEIYDNAEDKDGIDFNGLPKFHEAVIANIINIYALVDLPGKTDEVRNACKLVIKEANPYDNEQIKEDFNERYRLMNGMELREMDKIIYPVCTLCRDHERSGFIEGIKIGVLLQAELTEE